VVHLKAVDHSEFPFVDHYADSSICRLATAIVTHLQHDVVGIGGGDHLVGLGDGEGQRLVDEHVLGSQRSSNGEVAMRRVRRGDEDPVEVESVEELVERAGRHAPVLLSKLLPGLG
jgi:hypothetical protein